MENKYFLSIDSQPAVWPVCVKLQLGSPTAKEKEAALLFITMLMEREAPFQDKS
jgi:hypothetical protein